MGQFASAKWVNCTPALTIEWAEVFAMYIDWAPGEILELSEIELEALEWILRQDPRDLSPLQLHRRWEQANAISPTVGQIVSAHDAKRSWCRTEMRMDLRKRS